MCGRGVEGRSWELKVNILDIKGIWGGEKVV